jgi:uncharacterized delta-60 repeat protein
LSARGAAGDVDASFNAETGVSGWVHAVTPLADGKVLIGGEFKTVQGISRPYIARLAANGSIDQAFNASELKNAVVFAQAIQTDGKIVVGGNNTVQNQGWICRLNSDGAIDSSFQPPSNWGQSVTKLLLQPDGKIIVGGLFSTGGLGSLVARLNSDGSIDNGFNLTAFAGYSDPPSIAVENDDKLIVSAVGRPIRFFSDGSVDPSFSAPRFDYAWVDTIAAQPDGKVLVAGRLRLFAYSDLLNLIRLNSDGSMDTNFIPLRRGDYSVSAIYVNKDGSILVSGSSHKTNELLWLKENGSIDSKFVPPNGAGYEIYSIAVDESQRIFVGGAFAWPGGVANVARLLAGGTLDVSFQPGFSLTSVFVPAVAIDRQSKVVAALSGFETRGSGVQRFNYDGSVDTNFVMTPLPGEVTALALGDDEKILVASHYTVTSANSDQPVDGFDFRRLNSDGTVDGSFIFNPGKEIDVMGRQPDGKILVSGPFETLYGFAADRVSRLNPTNGAIDRSFQSLLFFGSGRVEYDIPRCLAVQPDGKILVGLELLSCHCDGARVAFRLDSDGSYDPSFDWSEFIPSHLNCMAVQPDGKILVGGFQFFETNTIRHGMLRLNPDGSLDHTFIPSLPMGSDVYAIAIEQSGKIVVNNGYMIMRLNADGSLDTSFKTARSNTGVFNMSLAPDGNMYGYASSLTTVSIP